METRLVNGREPTQCNQKMIVDPFALSDSAGITPNKNTVEEVLSWKLVHLFYDAMPRLVMLQVQGSRAITTVYISNQNHS